MTRVADWFAATVLVATALACGYLFGYQIGSVDGWAESQKWTRKP